MPKKSPDFYYLEADGQVFLVKQGKIWRFPNKHSELPCRYRPVFLMPLEDANVLFGIPLLKHHPEHWFHKDSLIGRQDVAPVVREAVNRSLPRGAAKVALIEKGLVLMVKGKRGITKGMWNLPGGFIGYGEHPAESAKREVLEELGTRVHLKRLLGVYSQTFPRTGGYMISFVYLGKRLTQVLRPHPEEIEEVKWMPLRQALAATANPFAKAALRDYLKSPKQ